ncbi:MAG: serine/threonine-protein kinase [Planctomycetota bacterium]
MSQSKPDPLVGRTVDGYRIEELLGRGGMGTVYKATQLSLGRPIALKILGDDLATDEQFLARFHREADALSRLSHPNIVTVLERGEVDGKPYLAMEYIDGPSLRQVMREGKMPPAEALKITSSVLAALQHAHDKGIVHRDIKPENVLLARGDVVKVADFGLSRLVDGPDMTRLTRTNLVLGTYEYMAPEQREHSREADHRADLYATGVIFYEMLTGELPIGRFALPSRQRPNECDARIDRIVERSLEKNPDRRFQDADEMAGAVSGILERPSDYEQAVPDSTVRYRPAKFEHHIDNLSTIDQVLGTVFYILGIMSLFGMGRVPFLFGGGIGFIVLFIMGWYLRETGEQLRKYKLSARVSQAVISVIAGFTIILIPFTIYSFWVLFGHRGRTYYEARNRGLTEREAASHTFEVVEEEITPPPAPVVPSAPRPSQIPVQSMVMSEAAPAPPPVKKRRFSPMIWFALLPLVVFAILAIARLEGARIDDDVIWTFFWIGMPLLALGLVHAIYSPTTRGAYLAAVLGTGFALGAIGFEEEDSRMRGGNYAGFDQTFYVGQVRSFAVDTPDINGLTMEQMEWVKTVTGDYPGHFRIRRNGNYIVAEVDRRQARRNPKLIQQQAIAVELALQRSYPTAIRTGSSRNRSATDDYYRARFQAVPSPWDGQPGRVWIGTFTRPPAGETRIPTKESLKLTDEQWLWLASVSGFRDANLLQLEVEGGLIHAVLPKASFYREPEAAWKLVLAAQQLVTQRWADRKVKARRLFDRDTGLDRTRSSKLERMMEMKPPPSR